MKKKKQLTKICPICKGEEDKKWLEYSPGCSRLIYFCCEAKKEKTETIGFSFHKFNRQPVAFGIEKATGKPIAIDNKGKRFDPSETRYAQYPDDRYGWKATGKIKAKKKYFV